MGIFNWTFAAEVFPTIFKAMFVTLGITLAAFAVALVVGLILALLRRSKIKAVAYVTYAFIEFVRGTPVLVQLFFVYFAWPMVPVIGFEMSAMTAGIATLGIHYSTYLSEIYRSGIEAVDQGQWEASTALNFSKAKTWSRIILPQAIPPVIPMLGNYLIVLFKETPLLMAISVNEMLLTARNLGSQVFSFVEVYTIVGLLFLLLSYPSSLLVGYAERRMNNRYMRKAKKVKKKDVIA